MSAPAQHLRVVDTDTGEIIEHDPNACPHCVPLLDQIKGLQRDIRGWAQRFAELKRDKEAEAKAHADWPLAVRLFEYWQQKCNHPGSGWTVDRFEAIQPFLRHKKYGPVACVRAIDGAAFAPFTTQRKNGSTKRHDDWGLIFREADRLEDFANRAPRGWQLPGAFADLEPDKPKRGEQAQLGVDT